VEKKRGAWIVSLDIDAVVIWVDGNDPALRAKQNKYFARRSENENVSDTRFASCNEVLYSVGSLLRFAPFLRHIFIVTDDQIPPIQERLTSVFGSEAVRKIKIVDHKTIFAGYETYLPVFNSSAIETMLHRIPDIAENFIFLNDDFFIVRPTTAADFFRDGKPVLRGRDMFNFKFLLRLWLKSRKAQRQPEREAELESAHKETQVTASRMAGRIWRIFMLDHTPHAMRRSVLQRFLQSHPEAIDQNIRHRLRYWKQFDAAALAAALEIQQGNRLLEERSLVYIHLQDSHNPLAYLRRKLNLVDSQAARFVCMQSLDQAPPEFRSILINWLEDRILKDQA
jgi:hypothetical protein